MSNIMNSRTASGAAPEGNTSNGLDLRSVKDRIRHME